VSGLKRFQVVTKNSMKHCIAFAVTLLCVVFLTAAADPTISCALDETPREQGLRLERQRIGPREVVINGQRTHGWVSGHKSVPADEWARSFLFTVTDPAFKAGKMPAVEIEIVYLHTANTKVEVVADTATGSRVIGQGWGNNPDWQTLRIRLDDAYFGARRHGNPPGALPSDGYDLRINAFAGDFLVRSVTIRGISRSDVSDWSRFISTDPATSTSGFIVEPGKSDTVTFPLRNRATTALDVRATWRIVDGNGRVLETREEASTLPPDSVTKLQQPFKSDGRPNGEYAVRLDVATADPAKGGTLLVREQPLVIAGPDDLFIVFDRVPLMRGMDFDRAGLAPELVSIEGMSRYAWTAGDGAQRGADGWWKSVVIKVVDPRFVRGGRPAVDVTVNYRHTANAPLNLVADTASGSRDVAGGWGNNQNWQTLRARIDDARFAQTDYKSDPKAIRTDGFDLRVNFNSGNGQLRSVFVRGYPLDTPDFSRLIRFDAIDAGRELYIFEPGEKADLVLKLTNLATKPLAATYQLRLLSDFGDQLGATRKPVSIPASGGFSLPFPLDTKGLKQGVYTVELQLGTEDAGRLTPLIERTINVMVSEKSVIPKARDGEFLYGLDTGVSSLDDRWLQWCDFMGADILRGPGHGHNHTDQDALAAAYEAIARHNLRSSAFFDIPWHPDQAARERAWAELAGAAETISRRFGDKVLYYELGNEPDLTFFYPGPIEEYARGYEIVSKAIKRGDPRSKVMNGGLSFAGEEGDRRSRRFIEVVDLQAVDAFAYHAHGPGAQSERATFEKTRAVMRQFGKESRPLVQTESGTAARTPAQIRIQARSAIQKMVYAQSVGVEAFMWFRLFISGADEDYTNLRNVHEPRPVALAYRTLTRSLKGLKFARVVPLESSDQEAYLFVDATGGPRRALVLWANGSGGTLATLNVGPVAKAPVLRDLFGNDTPLALGGIKSVSAILSLPVDNDPFFALWESDADPAKVSLLPSAIRASPTVAVTPGGNDTLVAELRNDSDTLITATLSVVTSPKADTTPTAATQEVKLPPNSTTPVTVNLRTAEVLHEIEWPRRWMVFTALPKGGADIAGLTEFSDEIRIAGTPFRGTVARARDGRLELARLAGGIAERAEALCLAEVVAPADMTVKVGAAADWWMAWSVNGKPVFDTLEAGNGGAQTITTHLFDLPLRKGRNLLAVRVLSGSQGFNLTSGGPREVAAARGTADALGDDLALELRSGQVLLARKRVTPIRRYAIPVPPAPLGPATANADLEPLLRPEPVADLSESSIVNELSKQPDSSKWWKGQDDLSASIWLYADDKNLYVLANVRDDTNRPGDNFELQVGGADGKVLSFDARTMNARIDRHDSGPLAGTTRYLLAVPRDSLPKGPLAINARVIDDDFGGLKQFAAWSTWSEKPVSTSNGFQAYFRQ
jgi:hypothetical protein